MNIGELRKRIEGMPDDAPVLLESGDHSYRECDFLVNTALRLKGYGSGAEWTEDVFIPKSGDGIGEVTAYGVRTIALALV
jgi:hypothetical protein